MGGRIIPTTEIRHMATKTHTYTVQKGDAVRPEFVGTKVGLVNEDTLAGALSLGHFENEAAVMAAANAQRNIAANRVVRKALSVEGAKIDEAIKAANAIKVGSPRAASTPKSAKPSTIRKNTAAASGNRLFEKCATDGDFLRRMVSQQIVDQAEYDTWLANRNLKDPKAAPKAEAPATNGATTEAQASAPAASAPKRTPASAKAR
jgi:hypothetical protein